MNDSLAIITLALVVATLLLVSATVYLGLEARKIRKEEEGHRKEVAFRAAILELSNNIISLTPHNPTLSKPNISWDYPMKFPKLMDLMDLYGFIPNYGKGL